MRRRLKHPILGFVSGAFTGGGLVTAVFTLGYAMTYPVDGSDFIPTTADVIRLALACFVIATTIWSLGLIVVGYPLWALLHHRGVRGTFSAALTGFAAVYAVGLLWPPTSIEGAVELNRILLAIAGGIVGAVIELVAFRRVVTPPPVPPYAEQKL